LQDGNQNDRVDARELSDLLYLTFHAFHYDIVDAFLMTDVVEDADVGMIQQGNGLGLALEPLPGNLICGELCRKNLEGDDPLEPGVARAIDFAHATGIEAAQTGQVDSFAGRRP
jgi:hypothetical protein